MYFAETYADVPVWSGLLECLEATFLRFDLGESEDFGTPEVRRLLSTGVPVDIALIGGALAFGVGLGAVRSRRR